MLAASVVFFQGWNRRAQEPGKAALAMDPGSVMSVAALADGQAELLANQGLFAQDLRGPLKKLHIFRKCAAAAGLPPDRVVERGL